MEENTIRIRPIGSLLNDKFRVPRYQRGYRWGEQQITELLDDIWEYSNNICNKSANVGNFYCLQPIVVKSASWKETQENGNEIEVAGWDLIDGQQRLTTLFVILSYLEDIRQFHDKSNQKFSITFETRYNCIGFLNNNSFIEKIDDSNVDFYHISKCYDYVKEWFNDKLEERLDILRTILNQKEFNVSVLWYEVKDNNSDPIDIFTRLNIGKIPLTDAELIKALMLQSDKYPKNDRRYYEQRLFEIATEWDEMEAMFKDEKFWCFINNEEKTNKGIEFIFDILAKKWHDELNLTLPEKEKIKTGSKHFAYLVFNKYIEHKRLEFLKKSDNENNLNYLEHVNDIWKEIKDLFNIFKEWYCNHTLYHYIGYLITIKNENIEALIQLSKDSNKDIFINELRKRIGKEVNYKVKKNDSEYKSLDDFVYGSDNNIIINILLLFNIESIVKMFNKENYRFPFHLFKKEKIASIEHIHPQNPEDISDNEDRAKEWLKSHEKLLNDLPFQDNNDRLSKGNQLAVRINKLLINYNKDDFHKLTQEIFDFNDEIIGIKENEKHTLYNLTLVDKDTNSALNNSFFDVKREVLKVNELRRYIPVCTMRAFEKYYSEAPKEMIFWSDTDRKSYFNAIKNVIYSFINLV